MRVYTHSACLQHDPGSGHPECPARLHAVIDSLKQAMPGLDWREAPLAGRDQIARVHTPALVARILDTAVEKAIRLDADTVLGTASQAAATRACGAGIAAVDAVLESGGEPVFCAVRPPGHHATAGVAMGFCLFNSIAVAAAHALAAHGLRRVAIVDFDVHHGNGTQDIFHDEPRVLYLSSHQTPLYPNSGAADETGVGNVRNAPLAPGAGSTEFRAAWSHELLPVLDAFAPELVLVSAGFDAHRLDPLADLQLVADDFRWLSTAILDISRRHCPGRIVSMLEGGYSPAALRECVVAHLEGLGG